MIVIVVAVADNGVIGRDGGLPWRLSSDLRRFKAETMGRPVLMGRRTWESIGRPLPGRLNIVVSRDRSFRAEGAETATTLTDALTLARVRGRCLPGEAIFVIGGGEIYRQAMPIADRLYVTHVLASPYGDTTFPEIDPADWREVSSEDHPVGEKDTEPTRFVVYARRR